MLPEQIWFRYLFVLLVEMLIWGLYANLAWVIKWEPPEVTDETRKYYISLVVLAFLIPVLPAIFLDRVVAAFSVLINPKTTIATSTPKSEDSGSAALSPVPLESPTAASVPAAAPTYTATQRPIPIDSATPAASSAESAKPLPSATPQQPPDLLARPTSAALLQRVLPRSIRPARSGQKPKLSALAAKLYYKIGLTQLLPGDQAILNLVPPPSQGASTLVFAFVELLNKNDVSDTAQNWSMDILINGHRYDAQLVQLDTFSINSDGYKAVPYDNEEAIYRKAEDHPLALGDHVEGYYIGRFELPQRLVSENIAGLQVRFYDNDGREFVSDPNVTRAVAMTYGAGQLSSPGLPTPP